VAELRDLAGKRVLVTGALGYVGSSLVGILRREGIDVLAVDKRAGHGSVTLDLCDRKETIGAVGRFRPDFVVHCGTHSALAYKGGFLPSFREDASALANLLEALSGFPGCRLVFFSSSYVYSGLDVSRLVSESSLLNPSHDFGVAKSFFEQFVLRSHPDSVVFRLSSVFGPGNALNPNAVLGMARECMDSGKLAVWGSGSRKMQYVYMADVLRCVARAFTIHPGIYNLGGSDYLTVANSAGMIADFFKVNVVFLRDRKEGETLPFMDCSALAKAAGVRMTPFGEALSEYLGTLQEKL